MGGTTSGLAGLDLESDDLGEELRNFSENFYEGMLYYQFLALIPELAPKIGSSKVTVAITEASLGTLLDVIYEINEAGDLSLPTFMTLLLSNFIADSNVSTKQLESFLDNFKGAKTLDDFAEIIRKLSKGDSDTGTSQTDEVVEEIVKGGKYSSELKYNGDGT